MQKQMTHPNKAHASSTLSSSAKKPSIQEEKKIGFKGPAGVEFKDKTKRQPNLLPAQKLT